MKALWRTPAASKEQIGVTLLLVGEPGRALPFDPLVLRRNEIRMFSTLPGPGALDLAQREPVDLILIEERPETDETIRLSRNLKSLPITEDIPIVWITSDGAAGLPDGALADLILPRPVREAQFVETIRRFVPLRERRHARYAINLRFGFAAKHRSGQAFSRVISYGGAFLKTDRVMPVGTSLELWFRLPGDEDEIRCRGTVRNTVEWEVETTLTPGFGVEFEQLSGADDRRLAEFLRGLDLPVR